MVNEELLQRIEKEKNILHRFKKNKGSLTGFLTARVAIAYYDILLKERENGRKTKKKTLAATG